MGGTPVHRIRGSRIGRRRASDPAVVLRHGALPTRLRGRGGGGAGAGAEQVDRIQTRADLENMLAYFMYWNIPTFFALNVAVGVREPPVPPLARPPAQAAGTDRPARAVRGGQSRAGIWRGPAGSRKSTGGILRRDPNNLAHPHSSLSHTHTHARARAPSLTPPAPLRRSLPARADGRCATGPRTRSS